MRRWFNLIILENNNTLFDILINAIMWFFFLEEYNHVVECNYKI